MRQIIALLALVLVVPACTSGEEPPAPSLATTEAAAPHECDAEPGSPTDLSVEPADWEAFGDHQRWTDGSGCKVRLDVISHIHGAAHCDWESAEFITIGRPLGAATGVYTEETINRYVWDPEHVLFDGPLADSIDLADLPQTAIDTGYRQGGSVMWIDESDESVLFVVHDDFADVWQRDLTAGLCD
jgi:hypothetical protein